MNRVSRTTAGVVAASSLLLFAAAIAADKDKEPDLPLEGSTETLAFPTDEGSWMSIDITADGQSLVFDLLGDLYTLPVTGGEATRITSGLGFDSQPVISPDGRRIAFPIALKSTQEPARTRLLRRHAGFDDAQIALDVRARHRDFSKALARDWDELFEQQTASRARLPIEPG